MNVINPLPKLDTMKKLLFVLLILASCKKEKLIPKPCTGNQCKMYPRLEEPVRRIEKPDND